MITPAIIPILPNFDAQILLIKSIGPPILFTMLYSNVFIGVCQEVIRGCIAKKKPPGNSRGHNSTRGSTPIHRGLSQSTELLLRALAST